MSLNLRDRLAVVVSFVPEGAKIVDVGTDHAYVPIHLAAEKNVQYIVAGELNPGPFQAAKESIEKLGLQEKISLRFGNGLSVVRPGEVDVATIAGMGGNTIVQILQNNMDVVQGLKRLILQPMIATVQVRTWLITNGWRIIEEELVMDEGKLYEVIVAEPGKASIGEDLLLEIGPILWEKRPPLLAMHMNNLIGQTKRVLQEMSYSNTAQHSPKYELYLKKAKQLEAMRQCL